MSNKIISNNVVFDKVVIQRADNSCIYEGDINMLDTILFYSTNLIVKTPLLSKYVYFTSTTDLQGFTASNSTLSIVDIDDNKKALRSDYKQYNKLVSPSLTGIKKLLSYNLYAKGNFRVQIYKNGTLLSTNEFDESEYKDISSSIHINDLNAIYDIRLLANQDSYYEVSTISYCGY